MLDQIDWNRPWLDAIRPAWARIDPQRGLLEELNAEAAAQGLLTGGGRQLRFVPQEELPEGVAYESHIADQGHVPTRDNLHDFFNALVWLSFPRIKRQLNAMQAAQIRSLGVGQVRGPARDALTIFDENAAILVARTTIAAADVVEHLRNYEWSVALFDARDMWGRDLQLWTFGHALMEKLTAPRKPITAHVRVLGAPSEYFAWASGRQRAWIDATLAAELADDGVDTSHFTPLPVLGIPGWWEGQDEAFYADHHVFRPKRHKEGE